MSSVRPDDVGLPGPDEQSQTSGATRTSGRRDDRERTRELFVALVGAGPAQRSAIRDEVVASHLWLAASAARRFGAGDDLEDLVQVARTGLVEAFDRFDPEQSSYAGFAWLTMMGLLRRHLRDHGWSVRPPRTLQESADVLRAAIPGLTQELRRSPTATDLAEHLDWSTLAVREAARANQGLRAASLETLVGDAWVPEQPHGGDDVETRLLLGRALRTLTDDERELIRFRFLEQRTQVEIAAALDMNQMGVSRRLGRLMLKLRTAIGELDGDEAESVSAPPTAYAGMTPEVEQAKGVVMGCCGCDAVTALALLERAASRRTQDLRVIAAEVVDAFRRPGDPATGVGPPAYERLRRALDGVARADDFLGRAPR